MSEKCTYKKNCTPASVYNSQPPEISSRTQPACLKHPDAKHWDHSRMATWRHYIASVHTETAMRMYKKVLPPSLASWMFWTGFSNRKFQNLGRSQYKLVKKHTVGESFENSHPDGGRRALKRNYWLESSIGEYQRDFNFFGIHMHVLVLKRYFINVTTLRIYCVVTSQVCMYWNIWNCQNREYTGICVLSTLGSDSCLYKDGALEKVAILCSACELCVPRMTTKFGWTVHSRVWCP